MKFCFIGKRMAPYRKLFSFWFPKESNACGLADLTVMKEVFFINYWIKARNVPKLTRFFFRVRCCLHQLVRSVKVLRGFHDMHYLPFPNIIGGQDGVLKMFFFCFKFGNTRKARLVIVRQEAVTTRPQMRLADSVGFPDYICLQS